MKRKVKYVATENYGNSTAFSEKVLNVDVDTYLYIQRLKSKINELEHEKHGIEAELRAIKPVVETGNLTPAVSRECGNCKYVVRSSWSNDIIGCRKSCTCEDFTPEEK